MSVYLFILILLLALELLYFKVADKFNIIDKPNQRSSHTRSKRPNLGPSRIWLR